MDVNTEECRGSGLSSARYLRPILFSYNQHQPGATLEIQSIFASPPLLPEADGGKMLWAVIASKYAALESETFTLEKLSDAEASRATLSFEFLIFPLML